MDSRAVELRHQLAQMEYKAQFNDMIAVSEYHGYDVNADSRVVALIGLRDAYFGMGDEARAEQNVVKAIALARKEASAEALCDALCSAAAMNAHYARYDAQLTRWAQEALTIAEAQNYTRGVVLAGVTLALVKAFHGAKSAALAELERLLGIAQKLPDRDDEARVLSALAQVSGWMGKRGKAADYQRRGMAIYFQSGNDLDRSIALVNMASYHFAAWRAFRSYEQAMIYLREGLALARSLKYRYGELVELNVLGSFYLISRQPTEAADTFEKVIDLARQYGLKRYEWDALLSLGAAYMQLKQYDKARSSLQERIALSDWSNHSLWDVFAHYQMGNVYQQQKSYEDALRCWNDALALEKQLPGKRRTMYYVNYAVILYFTPYYALRRRLRV